MKKKVCVYVEGDYYEDVKEYAFAKKVSVSGLINSYMESLSRRMQKAQQRRQKVDG